MLQVKDIDDVGMAYDMLDEYDVPLTLSLGRHTNDKTFSFYCATPSLFNVEVGYDGIEVDGDWVPQVYNQTAIWGHKLDPEAKNRPPGIMHSLATDCADDRTAPEEHRSRGGSVRSAC